MHKGCFRYISIGHDHLINVPKAQNCEAPSTNNQMDYAFNIDSLSHFSTLEPDKTSTMSRRVKSTTTSLETDEQATLVEALLGVV